MATPVTANYGIPKGTLGDAPFKRSFRSAMDIIDEELDGLQDQFDAMYLFGSKTWDPADTADGARATTTATVTGAALGDTVEAVSFSLDLAGGFLYGYVSAANTVTVVLMNEKGTSLDLASGTLRVLVRKAAV